MISLETAKLKPMPFFGPPPSRLGQTLNEEVQKVVLAGMEGL